MVANGMTGQRESRRRCSRGEGKEGGGGREARSGWDEKFSLASLRCLYTRGSCMAMGHISVSRERGAPPKNQIECKNRINSSCKLESYVRPVGSLSKLSLFPLLFSLPLSLCFFSFSHALYLKLVWSSFLFLSSAPLRLFLRNQASTSPRSHDSTSRKGRSPLPYFLLFYLSARRRVMWLAELMKDPLFIDK